MSMMMTYSKHLSLTILFVLTFLGFNSQGIVYPLEGLIETYESLSSKLDVNISGNIHVKYNVEATDIDNKTKIVHFDLYANKHRSYILSSEYDVFQDSISTVAILHDKKKINVLGGHSRRERAQSIERVMSFQPSLFENLSVRSCEQIEATSNYKLILDCSDFIKEQSQIKSYEFVVDFERKHIKTIVVNFGSNRDNIKKVRCHILEINIGEMNTELKDSPMSKIYKKDKTLLPEYKSYTLIDLTEKSNS